MFPTRWLPLLLTLAAAGPTTAAGETPAEPPLARFGWLADLAGSCWTGSDAEGKTTDRQCYSTQFDRYLRGTIRIQAGSATGKSAYAGDSVFAWDPARGRIVYSYWASAGHFGQAECHYEGERLVFPPADEGEGKAPRIRSIWERIDADSFRVVREKSVEGSWVELMRAVYRRDAAPTPGAPETGPLAPIAWLAGSCWTGTFADGITRDLVCYDWMLGGKFLRSRHRVVGGKGPYSGETVLAHDPATRKLGFTYFNSVGGILRGEMVPTPEGLLFPAEKGAVEGKAVEIRSVWKRQGEDRYVATSERFEAGAWRPFLTIDFVRSGPASDWTEGE